MTRAARRLLALTLLVSLQALGIQITAPFAAPSRDDTATAAAQSAYANLPLAFEPNLGQADNSVDFLVHHGQAVTAFSSTGITTSVGGKQVRMSLAGAAAQDFAGTDELQSKTNYFIGNDESQWHSDIPNYGKLLAKDVYSGIDLAYYGTNSQLEHDFIVSPGADYKQIAFGFTGQDDLSLDKNGNLVLKAGDDTLTLNAPVTYQTDANSKHTIPSSFELRDGTVTVAVADTYDPAKPLVIDPVLSLVYSTYLGGSGEESAWSMSVDSSGSAYVVGSTTSSNFPTGSPFQASSAGGTDAFVAKLDQAGSALVYATYLGGAGSDIAVGVATDGTGNAYISGYTTSTNFPTASPFQASNAGGQDIFVTKLNTTGSALVYSTYLGGTGLEQESLNSTAVDASGNVYVAGNTRSTNFPTVSPIQATNSGGIEGDVFLAKFNAAGSALVYSTYLGGSASDVMNGMALESNGNVLLTGYTGSANFPTASPFQASNAGSLDAFVTKVNSAGSALVYSTYLGGSSDDRGSAVAVDTSGNAYVTGRADSTDFPTASPFQVSNAGGQDAFVTKLNAAGSALAYSTYLGGNGNDRGEAIAIDPIGNAYVTGYVSSTNFPTAVPFQASNAGGQDAFVTKLNAAGSALVYSTYLGGSGTELPLALALGLGGNVFIAGQTTSSNFPTAVPFQASNAGGNDVFITQFTDTVDLEARVNPTLTFAVGSTSCSLGTLSATQTQQCTYTLSAATNGQSGYAIAYLPAATLTSGGNTITALGSSTASTLNTEQFGLNLTANTAAGSHTATDFGAAPSGGAGAATANYATANSFKFATAGDQVASSAGPSLATTYTVSTIANIGNTTEAGAYSTTVTFTIVAGY